MCANSAIAMRSSFHASDSPSTRRNRIDRCQRLPATSPRAHRRRAVLQDDQIDAGGADQRRGRGRPRQREDGAGAREDQAQPEHQAAEHREPLAHRQPPVLPEAPRVAPPRRQLPEPAEQQHAGRDQQPQVLRRRERMVSRSMPSIGFRFQTSAKPEP